MTLLPDRFWPALLVVTVFDVCQALVLMSAERVWPAVKGQRRLRPGFFVDLGYVYSFALLGGLLHLNALSGAGAWFRSTAWGPYAAPAHALIGGLPLVVQVAVAVVIADLLGYGKHRLLHTRPLWPFHAIHHSGAEVDWLTNERVHPVEGLLTTFVQLLPLALLGFAPRAIVVATMLRRAHSLYQHANLRFAYGALDRVFVSPQLHRWHHATDPGMLDRNYANVFALWDWAFGTFRRPPGPAPAQLGLPEVPGGFLAQLAYPFRR